jgi:PAS domain S-box-containing protein
MSVSVLFIANNQLIRIIDESQNIVYTEKIEAIWGNLYRSNERLMKTGLVEAYAEDFKEASLKDLRHTYYNHPDQLIYPFIIDADGIIVMHPVLSRDDFSLEQTEIAVKMLASSEGAFEYTYLGQKKWLHFKQFPEWNWVIGYVVPLDIKYADAYKLRNILAIIIVLISVSVLLVLSWIISRFTKPIIQLTKVSSEIADGNLDKAIEVVSKDEIGTLARSFSNMRDAMRSKISELEQEIEGRGKAEEALMESEKRLRTIVETEPECVKILGPDGTLVDMNPAGLAMIEAESLDMVKGQSILPIVNEEFRDEFIVLSKKVFKGETGILEFRITSLKGTPRWLETHAVPLRNTAGDIIGLLGVSRDITERKKAEKEQERLNTELEIKNKELEQVLYVTSHDLRSPLVNVDGYSKELDYSLKDLMSFIENVPVPQTIKDKITLIVKEDIPESLHYIQISVVKMETLLRGILTLSRLGRSELTINEIDMNEMMTDIVDNHRFRLNESGIKTEVSKLPNCKGDSSQINQVFSNLLDNAIKYSDSERSCVINISGYKDRNQSVYCMDDNGLGIAPEHQDKIFEIFHQLEPGRVKGEGMGLTIAHRIIEKHNGKIWVESESGKGSKFFVSLPAK